MIRESLKMSEANNKAREAKRKSNFEESVIEAVDIVFSSFLFEKLPQY
jgi:hypothetical protein